MSRIDRREFLRRGALGGLGVGLLPLTGGASTPGVQRYRALGRTGIQMSDVSFGSSRLAGDEDVVRHALDRGINYFDSAESYKGGRSEETLGRALAGSRDRVFLVSKTNAGRRIATELMGSLEASLRRLRTDYVDVYLNHAVNGIDRLENPAWPEFVTRAKEQGKIRFTGMSGHGGRLVECLDHALDHDLVDVVLVGYNFGQDPAFHQRFTQSFDFVAIQPDLPRVLARAREKGVGIVAMKTLRGGRLNDLRPYETEGVTYAQAALRWVLAGGLADGLVITMRSREEVDEYVGASGWQGPGSADVSLLRRYEARNGSEQCRYGCSACSTACPHQVPIPDVLRARMYAHDYGDPELAAEAYAALGAGAEACVGCAHQSCRDACPFGLEIEKLTAPVHRELGR